jgi:hypothetical protein
VNLHELFSFFFNQKPNEDFVVAGVQSSKLPEILNYVLRYL